MTTRIRILAAILVTVVIAAACGDDSLSEAAAPSTDATPSSQLPPSTAAPNDGGAPTTAAPPGTATQPGSTAPLVVWATEDLGTTVEQLAAIFEEAFAGISFELVVLPGSELSSRFANGERPDLYFEEAGVLAFLAPDGLRGGSTVPFGNDVIVISVAQGNPLGIDISSFDGDPAVLTAVCEPSVPCGALGSQVLAAARITAAQDRVEPTGIAIVDGVADGAFDGGLVLRSESRTRFFKNSVVRVPEQFGAGIRYEIAQFSDRPAADGFVTFATESDAAARVVGLHGLGPLVLEPPSDQ